MIKKSLWSFDHSTLCSTYVCFIKIRSKLSSELLLCLLRFFMKQTLCMLKAVFIKQVTAHHTKKPAIKAVMMKSQITQHLQKKDHTSQIQNKYHIIHSYNKDNFSSTWVN